MKMNAKLLTHLPISQCLVLLTFLTSTSSGAQIDEPHMPLKLLLTPGTITSTSGPPSVAQLRAPDTSSGEQKSSQPAPVDETASEQRQQQEHHSATTQRADNTWIESILIQVESLNLNNERERSSSSQLAESQVERQQQDGELSAASRNDEADDCGSRDYEAVNGQVDQLGASAKKEFNVSQVPTDSGEDPLETSTLGASLSLNVTLDSLQQLSNATQYQIGGASTANLSQISDDSQRFNDENSVSQAVFGSSQDASATRSHERRPQVKKQPISCEQAYTRCALRSSCAPALKVYNEDCQDLISNRTSECSGKCLKAMIALRSSDEGDNLVNCDCQANEHCLQSKQRSQVCRPQVEEAVDPKTVVSCSTASWICMADQSCSIALGYYYRNCQSLFSQRYCSMPCNNSLSILYHQLKASKLVSCQCDGSEEFPCVKYKTYTERLCLNRPLSNEGAGLAMIEADDPEERQTPEDNLTNDPDTFIMDSSSFTGTSGSNYNDNQEEYDDQRVAASDGNSGDSGLQMVEDNWIPLISGRYFTNLHQQQKSQHQQQHHRHQGQQQQQPRQRPRKRPPGHHQHDVGRGRYRSMFLFASSSSSQSLFLHPGVTRLLCIMSVVATNIIVFVVYQNPRIDFV